MRYYCAMLIRCAVLASIIFIFSAVQAAAQATMPPPVLCQPGPMTTVISADRALHNGEIFDCLRIESGAVTIDDGAVIHVTTLDQVGGSLTAGPSGSLIIRDVKPTDIDQFTTGIVVQGGSFTIHGSPRAVKARLSTEVKAGDTQIKLASVPSDLSVGMKLVLPDSRPFTNFVTYPDVTANTRTTFYPDGTAWTVPGYAIETFTITGISGSAVTLDHPASVEHPGSHSASGAVEFLPWAAFIGRTFTIASENPQGTRGHLMCTMEALCDVEYGNIVEMGRTTIQHLNPVTNAKGRYAAHIHFATHQQRFIGNVIQNSGPQKWCLTIHASNGQLLQDNIGIGCAGSGIMLELLTEHDNILDGNFMIGTSGNPTRGDLYLAMNESGFNSNGFWVNPPNIVTNNITANSGWDGFGIWSDGAQCGGTWRNNESFGEHTGYEPWYWGGQACDTVMDHSVVWNSATGVVSYPSTRVIWKDYVYRGYCPSASRDFDSLGIQFGDYEQWRVQLINPDIQCANVGIWVPYGDATPIGDASQEDLTFHVTGGKLLSNWIGVRTKTPSGAVVPETIQGHVTVLTDLVNQALPGGYPIWRDFLDLQGANLVALQRVLVQTTQPASALKVYAKEQAGDVIIPPMGYSQGHGGQTNNQAWAQSQVSIFGEIAPCALEVPWALNAYVCPADMVPPPPPPPPPTPPPPPALTLTTSGPVMVTTKANAPIAVTYADPMAAGGMPPVVSSCVPASQSLFAVGLTPVQCEAHDTAGQSITGSFMVTVVFEPPPPFNCTTNPLTLVINRQNGWPAGPTGAQLRFQTNRASTILFNPLVTPWTVTATDANGCTVKVVKP